MSASSQPLIESSVETATEAMEPVAPKARKRGGMFAPLGNRDYRLLFAGQLISLIGDAFYAVALPWYMLTQGGGAKNLGLVLTAYGVPLGAATLLGGWLSDKLRPRRVMLFSDFIRMLILAGMAWLTFGAAAPFAVWGVPPLWAIAAFAAALGFFDGMFIPASNAIAPDLLSGDQLQAANGLYYSLARLAQMIGPSIAGAAVANLGSPLAFAIDGVTFAVSTVTLVFIRGRAARRAATEAGAAPETIGATEATGATETSTEVPTEKAAQTTDSLWRFAMRTPYFLILLLVLIIANLLNGATEVALPAMAHGPLHGNAQGFGFMIAAAGAGGLAGGLLAGALGNLIKRGIISMVFFAAQSVALLAIAFAPTIFFAVGCMAAFGVLNGLGNVSFMTLLQRKLPRNLLGRIMGVFAFCNFATFPISVAVAGFAVAAYGPQPIIIGGAALLAGAMALAFLNRELRSL
jgi:MFS family permease